MIASLTGTLRTKSPTEVLVDVQGVGFAVLITLPTYETLGEPGSSVHLLTHLHVREDALLLYGFATDAEREMFRLLTTISGIGPKIAQGILSGVPVNELREHIVAGNVQALVGIPNVGKKTAERLVVELRDRLTRESPATVPGAPSGGTPPELRAEALLALTSLGFTRASAEKALRQVLQNARGEQLSVEELIKRALRHATNP